MDDPYQTLGLSRDASADDIRNAYRKLAKKHHPDLNPGDKKAEERFKTISAANEILSDPVKRGKFDRGEIDATGQERAQQPRYRDYADSEAGGRYSSTSRPGEWNPEDLSDIFGSMFGQGRPFDQNAPIRGQDLHYTLTIEFLDAINGATRRLTLPEGGVLDVKIPPGTNEGQVLRLRNQGGPGRNGAPNGDALIELHVEPHPFFVRDGQDIRLELPVTVSEAVLGGPVEVPTPKGPVRMRIPPHSDTGTELRLRERGVPAHGSRPAGALYAKLRVVIGPTDAAFEEFLRSWQPEHPNDPRRALKETP